MPTRHTKHSDGKYHVAGKTYEELTGSRAKVYHGTAYKTSGGLTKADLMKNKNGAIVSAKKSHQAKKEKRLEKAGFTTVKGKFGAVRISAVRKSSKGRKRSS